MIKELQNEDSDIPDRYAQSLKEQLGDRYTERFDDMELEQRIDAMEATLDVLDMEDSENLPAREEADVPHSEQPEQEKDKIKTFLEDHTRHEYIRKLRRKGGYRKVAEQLYK